MTVKGPMVDSPEELEQKMFLQAVEEIPGLLGVLRRGVAGNWELSQAILMLEMRFLSMGAMHGPIKHDVCLSCGKQRQKTKQYVAFQGGGICDECIARLAFQLEHTPEEVWTRCSMCLRRHPTPQMAHKGTVTFCEDCTDELLQIRERQRMLDATPRCVSPRPGRGHPTRPDPDELRRDAIGRGHEMTAFSGWPEEWWETSTCAHCGAAIRRSKDNHGEYLGALPAILELCQNRAHSGSE